MRNFGLGRDKKSRRNAKFTRSLGEGYNLIKLPEIVGYVGASEDAVS